MMRCLGCTAWGVKQVAELYPTESRRLDHVIWRHVSGRDVFKEEEVRAQNIQR